MKKFLSIALIALITTSIYAQDIGRLEVPPEAVPKRTFIQRLNAARSYLTPWVVPTVHWVYLVPSDRQVISTAAIERTALHLQAWYRWQLGGKTFSLHNPIVEVFQTDHTAAWYHDNPNGAWAGYFWNNVLAESSRYTGSGFYQPNDDWVIYIESGPLEGQYAGGTGGGYISGCAVLGDKDLASLRGEDPDWTLCRGIGGSGHEYGHTHSLPHPPPPPNPDWGIAIMGTGYMSYPNCILTESDKATLLANPFFTSRPFKIKPPVCPFTDGRPNPTPWPRPTPHPRP